MATNSPPLRSKTSRPMRTITYRRRLFLSFAFVFVLFSVAAILLEQVRQSSVKREALHNQLEIYLQMVERYLGSQIPTEGSPGLDSLIALWPQPIRVSLLSTDGQVVYDNTIADLSQLENHATRPEIQAAHQQVYGEDLRTSSSTSLPYLYLAKELSSGFVRVALPHQGDTLEWLRTDSVFVYWMITWLVVSLLIVSGVSRMFSRSVERLRDYALSQGSGRVVTFEENELADIGHQIQTHYRELETRARQIDQERERLLQHVMYLREGICFFDRHGKIEYFNGIFLQHLNSLSSQIYTSAEDCLGDPIFAPLFAEDRDTSLTETIIRSHGKSFSARLCQFDDGRREIILSDITEGEKMARLKREMTSNIAHELRTPVTSIRGYLETCLGQEHLPQEMRLRFLTKAHEQTLLLSELIRDISLLTKMDEAPTLFEREPVELDGVRLRLEQAFASEWEAHGVDWRWDVPRSVTLMGSDSLIYTIFRNLVENALRYAGDGVRMVCQLYRQDGQYAYFSFYDTGAGVPQEHLLRLFERFYRVETGRSRETGGTGLGLAIVKNAVLLHQGDISVKNRVGGGLEYLFRLPIG